VATKQKAEAKDEGPSKERPVARPDPAIATKQIERLGLKEENLEELLYFLKLCRYFDERMETLYRQGKLPGAIYSGRGQEGAHVGVAYALRPEDSLFPTHRDLSAQLVKGLDLKRVMAQYWGRIDGYTRGRDGNSHLGDWEGARTFAVISHLPIAYPVACGAALAYKRRGEHRVAVAICGEGATSNGRWHEALNVSAIYKLPVVWVVNNNQWAYSTPTTIEAPVGSLADRGGAYSMPGVRVDAQDVLDVYETAHEAVERARSGNGPTLVEAVSLRWRGHAGHDPARYVPQAVLEEYMTYRDPVKRFQELLLALGVIDDEGFKEVDDRIKREFDEGFEFAQSSPLPRPQDVTRGLWAEDGYWRNEPPRGDG
jgi:TPP-dependent pyruvate/acetoin dehydrogenase alpha subunit